MKGEKKLISAMAGAIMMQSCGVNAYMDLPAEEINDVVAGSRSVEDSIALPVTLKFDKRQSEYLMFLQKLAVDVIEDPNIAKVFSENPSSYLADNGFGAFSISMDDKLVKTMLILSDPKAVGMISDGDVGGFMNLMRKEGIIETVRIKDVPSTQAEFDKLVKKALYSLSDLATGEIITAEDTFGVIAFFLALVVGVAGAVWVAAVEYLLAGNAAAFGTVYYCAAAYSTTTLGGGGNNGGGNNGGGNSGGGGGNGGNKGFSNVYALRQVLQNEDLGLVMDLWNLKSGSKNELNHLVMKYIEDSIDSAIDYLEEKYPEEFVTVEKNTLKYGILKNIVI